MGEGGWVEMNCRDMKELSGKVKTLCFDCSSGYKGVYIFNTHQIAAPKIKSSAYQWCLKPQDWMRPSEV